MISRLAKYPFFILPFLLTAGTHTFAADEKLVVSSTNLHVNTTKRVEDESSKSFLPVYKEVPSTTHMFDRFIDTELNIVCYTRRSTWGEAMSCIKLDAGDPR